MADSFIDIEACLAPLSGDDPAGEKEVFYLVRDDLEDCRKAVDPRQYAEDDPTRPTEAKPADWGKIIALGAETLSTRCKHLEIAARLVEALTQHHGFPGLAEGLLLLRRFVEDCWDRMHPVIEDGDLEVRSGPFELIGTGNAGFNFPNTVRNVVFVSGKTGAFSWTDRQSLAGGKDSFDSAVSSTSAEKCQANFEALKAALTEIAALNQVLAGQMQNLAPSLLDLNAAVTDCYRLADLVVKQRGPAAGSQPTHDGSDEGSSEPGEASSGRGWSGGSDWAAVADRAVATRADLYRQLEQTAELLEKLEPRSPVPYLVRRAVTLGNLPFPDLLKILVRDAAAVEQISREFGVPASD